MLTGCGPSFRHEALSTLTISEDGRTLGVYVDCGGGSLSAHETAARVVVTLKQITGARDADACSIVPATTTLKAPVAARTVADATSGAVITLITGDPHHPPLAAMAR